MTATGNGAADLGPTSLLSVQSLCAVRAGSKVVDELTFEVGGGDIVALLGPNGAGKSTTVDAISGFVRKSSGQVTFAGIDITGYLPHRVSSLGLVQVSQSRDLFPSMSVRDNLTLGKRVAPRPTSDGLDATLALFPKLEQLLNQTAGSLSGGEQQMVAIGRALAGDPRMVILDEPTAGLAPKIVSQLDEDLHKLAETGLTILLVEQNVGVALSMCKRILVMQRGRKVFDDHPRSLGSQPREALAALYLS